MSDFLTLGKILDADDITYQEIEVPEWGGKVLLKGLTGIERDRLEQLLNRYHRDGEEVSISAEVALMVVHDGNKKPLFTRNELSRLEKKSALPLKRIFESVLQQNVVGADKIKDAIKN